jgi:hypothetical protein
MPTSQVLKRLADVLPDPLQQEEGKYFRRSVLKLGTALRKHAGLLYGDDQLSIRSQPGKRGMNLWQVYQVSKKKAR